MPGEQSEDLSDVGVWLDPPPTSRARSTPVAATIQLHGRQFTPRVRVVPEGSKIEFPNMDSFSHNVFSKAPDGAFDTGVYGRGRTKDQTFKDTGVFPIYCNIHPRMTGYVVVLRSPYFAQAGADGRFTVPAVPAGAYTPHGWDDPGPQETTRPATGNGTGPAVCRRGVGAPGQFLRQATKK